MQNLYSSNGKNLYSYKNWQMKKFIKIYSTDYNLLIVQDLWQAHYQILSIIFLKEFIKLNVNTDPMIKNAILAEFIIYILTVFLNTHTLMMI